MPDEALLPGRWTPAEAAARSIHQGATVWAAALEQASLAVGRLDRALERHPLRNAWRYLRLARAAQHHSAVDGVRIDLPLIIAGDRGLRVTRDPSLSNYDNALAWEARRYALRQLKALTLGLRTIARTPQDNALVFNTDLVPSQGHASEIPKDAASDAANIQLEIDHAGQWLAETTPARPRLVAAGLGVWRWLHQPDPAGQRTRSTIRAAVPRHLHEAGLTQQPLAGLAGNDALRAQAEQDAPAAWVARWLHALVGEADDGLQLLSTLTVAWERAHRTLNQDRARRGRKLRVDATLPAAIDTLVAEALLGSSTLAARVGCSPQRASGMLEELRALGIAQEITGRTAHRLYGLPQLVDVALSTSGPRRPVHDRPGRPRKMPVPIEQDLLSERMPLSPPDLETFRFLRSRPTLDADLNERIRDIDLAIGRVATKLKELGHT